MGSYLDRPLTLKKYNDLLSCSISHDLREPSLRIMTAVNAHILQMEKWSEFYLGCKPAAV